MSSLVKQTIVSGTTVDYKKVDRGQLLSNRIPEPVSAIVFTREFGFKANWSLRGSRPTVSIAGGDVDDDDDRYAHTLLARWGLLDKDDLTLYVRGLHKAENYEAPFSKFVSYACRPNEHDFAYDGWEEDPQTPGKARGGTGARDPLAWLKERMEHERFRELAKKSPDELCQQCEVVLREAVAMERQRIWQELFGLQ